MTRTLLLVITLGLTLCWAHSTDAEGQLKVRVSWGHKAAQAAPFNLRFLTDDLAVTAVTQHGFEAEDQLDNETWSGRAGAGDVDALEVTLRFPERTITTITNLQSIWAYLFAESDPGTRQRLQQDPAYRPDARKLTLQLDAQGSKGFSVTVDQLLRQKVFWVPSLDVFLTAGEPFVSWEEHQQQLEARKGGRILDQVQQASEATYEQFTARWEDMGHPAYKNAAQVGPGHLVGITWDSALHKFGIDRSAGVWNDYGNPDRFHSRLDFGDTAQELGACWKAQRLTDGLPVITTVFVKDGIQCEVEQFAYPLHGPPAERRGDMPMVLCERIVVSNLTKRAASVPVNIRHRRFLTELSELKILEIGKGFVLEDSTNRTALLIIDSSGAPVQLRSIAEPKPAKPEKLGAAWKQVELTVLIELPAHGSRELFVKQPSPVLALADRDRLLSLSHDTARQQTLEFWSDYLAKGALFQVPEPAVNELFRANLWHALRLPRRHGGAERDVRIDLPYSNFAYDQKGTPWPVNQAIYVDYMLYDLRGYHDISAEELRAIYRNNQQANGHVGGYANWGVYTPSMIYSVAKNYLLSGDRALFGSLLPQTLKALDWCLSEIKKSAQRPGTAAGLVWAPLNDLTGEGVWAFNQAYFFAGLDLLGKVLSQIEHPRAAECVAAAASFRRSVELGFGAASMLSPLVQLRDETWIPYVPCEVQTPQRLFQQWYPTDIDTGATHLLRLLALAPEGRLGDSLLHDHEDNLYLHAWGMANEPVYNQQATAYLNRDDPKAAIRAFYSMMACAFSHSVFEPVEHRWAWGQYFGPPSTDGAWFELYRQMLIREQDDDSLLLLQATPRSWLEPGKKIQVANAPTYYGRLSFTLESHANSGTLLAQIEMPERRRPKALLLRLRHPQAQPPRALTVNGRPWTGFDPQQEWLRIPNPDQPRYSVVAEYAKSGD